MRVLILLLLLGLLPGSPLAAHITDKLVVGLYAEPSAEGSPIELLSSGAVLEILSRREGFAEVEVASGERGWVEDRYVTDEKPAKAVLLETKARLRQQGLELAALRSERLEDPDINAAPAPAAGITGADLAADEAVRERIRMAIDVLSEVPGVDPEPPSSAPFSDWRAWIIGLAALALGFVGGIAYVDYKIRRRYGRFRF